MLTKFLLLSESDCQTDGGQAGGFYFLNLFPPILLLMYQS